MGPPHQQDQCRGAQLGWDHSDQQDQCREGGTQGQSLTVPRSQATLCGPKEDLLTPLPLPQPSPPNHPGAPFSHPLRQLLLPSGIWGTGLAEGILP